MVKYNYPWCYLNLDEIKRLRVRLVQGIMCDTHAQKLLCYGGY